MKTFSLRIILTLWLMEQRFCRNSEDILEFINLIKYMTNGVAPKNPAALAEMVIASIRLSQKQLPDLCKQIECELKKLKSWHNYTIGERQDNALRLWVKRQISLYGKEDVELDPLDQVEMRKLRRSMAKVKTVRVVEVHIIFE